MEDILHYVWKHKLFPLNELRTQDGKPVEVLNPGIYNTDAGPDFICAKVKIDGLLWVGNVEIHIRTSDWFRHRHDKDHAYDSIILHVASNIDESLKYPSGETVPQIQIEVPEYVVENYDLLISKDTNPLCSEVIGSISSFAVHSWLSALLVERLEVKVNRIMEIWHRQEMNWENTLFATVARSFGFGKNGDAFEMWANNVSLGALGKHRDDLFQIKSFFLGQAGMLDGTGINGIDENEYSRMCAEYKYLAAKFSLKSIDRSVWTYLRLRPQNFPHVRLLQLAQLYYEGAFQFSKIMNTSAKEDYMKLFDVSSGSFHLSASSKELLLINCIAPMLFAYGRYRNDQMMVDRALDLLEQLPPEDNRYIRDWHDAGIEAENAADSQALIQLHNRYCKKHDCLRCRFGKEYISHNPGWLREK